MSTTPMTRLPSEEKETIEEALGDIYECFEKHLKSRKDIAPMLDQQVEPGILPKLESNKYIHDEGNKLCLTEAGERIACEVIRRKRLAERLLKDVLNVKDEFIDPAVCQWEHILSREVTDSICTLLGHPKQSPRNLLIPAGECCRKAVTSTAPAVCSLDKIDRGQKARIAYLLMQHNPELQRLLSMGLVPGTEVEVLQRFPTIVVQFDQSQLAFDRSIAESVFVYPL